MVTFSINLLEYGNISLFSRSQMDELICIESEKTLKA
jgi:hypothetical protein